MSGPGQSFAWIDEMVELLDHGAAAEYRLRWREEKGPGDQQLAMVGCGLIGLATLAVLWVLGEHTGSERVVERVRVALYPAAATPGAAPTITFPVAPDTAIRDLPQGGRVGVRGTAEAGRALVLEGPEGPIPCVGPGRVPMWNRRRDRL